VLRVEGVLTRLRKSKWDNFSKTHFWELVLDGHPTAERLHNAEEECGCGAARGAGRAHVFWNCGGPCLARDRDPSARAARPPRPPKTTSSRRYPPKSWSVVRWAGDLGQEKLG
jgi:hypothetical protein